jgi:UDP-N-acetylmuramoyl-L-alanyl-D-glutamate--2,6-diaminopimelate ligase
MWQKLKNQYHLTQALISAAYFGFPSRKIKVIGITGTDGKTTTVNMIYNILKSSGKNVSMISSVQAQIGDKKYNTGFHVTTPNPWQIQKFLKEAVKKGDEYFILEATSHGLDQNRLAFIPFEISAVTNISHEHLDYHKTWEKYAYSKFKLFKNSKLAVLNKNDKSYNFLRSELKQKIYTYGLKNGDFNMNNLKIKLNISGDFNINNALAAASVASLSGISGSKISKSLAKFQGVPGRMEEVKAGQNFRVFIDFAHTPNSIKKALESLRKLSKNNKLIAVFGSAGERDKAKRPMMGKNADKFADEIILTLEDPRMEKVETICNEIKKGIKNKKVGKNLFVIKDRQEAINFAIGKAKNEDIVGIFGKGHEKSMKIEHKEYPWDEFLSVKKAIKMHK